MLFLSLIYVTLPLAQSNTLFAKDVYLKDCKTGQFCDMKNSQIWASSNSHAGKFSEICENFMHMSYLYMAQIYVAKFSCSTVFLRDGISYSEKHSYLV